MPVKRINKETKSQEEILAEQIGSMGMNQEDDVDLSNIPTEEEAAEILAAKEAVAAETPQSYVGQKLQHYGNTGKPTQDEMCELSEKKHLSRIGERISDNADIRDGWMTVDRGLLGERTKFYPEDWEFRIKPATVEAIRNWSTIDEENPNSIDIVFDEILKSCLAIRTNNGPQPWNQINTWDRFFFVLLIREYTFINGESKVEFIRECSNCESDVTFHLDAQSLMYDLPDEDVMSSYDASNRTWHIIPADYDIETDNAEEEIVLYIPTRDKDANIKNYMITKAQQDPNAKFDRVFFKFLPWMLPKVSKDANIAKGQIRKAEVEYKSWNIEMFEFMDNVVTNITVTPATTLVATCPACGEEVTAPIQFPNGIASLFHRDTKVGKRFGKK